MSGSNQPNFRSQAQPRRAGPRNQALVIKLDGSRLRHAVPNFQPTGVIAMRTDKSPYVDSVLVAALFMLALSGAMAIHRFLASDPTAEVIQFQTVRY